MLVNIKKEGFSALGFKSSLLSFLLVFILADASAQVSTDTLTYIVKPGDTLSQISEKFGSTKFWKPIYEANQRKIYNPDKIYSGQTLIIPFSITSSDKFAYSTEAEEGKDSEDTVKAKKDSSEVLKRFREAFEQVTNHARENSGNNKANSMIAREREIQNGLDIGGLVIDKTRSKMGRDFFKAFYNTWRLPEEAGNFMLEISEQPTPSLGAMVLIKVDNNIVHKARLQPRGSIIQKKAERAVIMCYRYIQQQISSSYKSITY